MHRARPKQTQVHQSLLGRPPVVKRTSYNSAAYKSSRAPFAALSDEDVKSFVRAGIRVTDKRRGIKVTFSEGGN